MSHSLVRAEHNEAIKRPDEDAMRLAMEAAAKAERPEPPAAAQMQQRLSVERPTRPSAGRTDRTARALGAALADKELKRNNIAANGDEPGNDRPKATAEPEAKTPKQPTEKDKTPARATGGGGGKGPTDPPKVPPRKGGSAENGGEDEQPSPKPRNELQRRTDEPGAEDNANGGTLYRSRRYMEYKSGDVDNAAWKAHKEREAAEEVPNRGPVERRRHHPDISQESAAHEAENPDARARYEDAQRNRLEIVKDMNTQEIPVVNAPAEGRNLVPGVDPEPAWISAVAPPERALSDQADEIIHDIAQDVTDLPSLRLQTSITEQQRIDIRDSLVRLGPVIEDFAALHTLLTIEGAETPGLDQIRELIGTLLNHSDTQASDIAHVVGRATDLLRTGQETQSMPEIGDLRALLTNRNVSTEVLLETVELYSQAIRAGFDPAHSAFTLASKYLYAAEFHGTEDWSDREGAKATTPTDVLRAIAAIGGENDRLALMEDLIALPSERRSSACAALVELIETAGTSERDPANVLTSVRASVGANGGGTLSLVGAIAKAQHDVSTHRMWVQRPESIPKLPDGRPIAHSGTPYRFSASLDYAVRKAEYFAAQRSVDGARPQPVTFLVDADENVAYYLTKDSEPDIGEFNNPTLVRSSPTEGAQGRALVNNALPTSQDIQQARRLLRYAGPSTDSLKTVIGDPHATVFWRTPKQSVMADNVARAIADGIDADRVQHLLSGDTALTDSGVRQGIWNAVQQINTCMKRYGVPRDYWVQIQEPGTSIDAGV